MQRFKRTIPLLALLVLVASFTGAAQTDRIMAVAPDEDGVNLRLLLFINELGLDQQQMETIAGLFQGVLDEQDQLRAAVEAYNQAFEDEMLAFIGTSEELEAAIDAHRAGMDGFTDAYQFSLNEMIDTLGETLTYAQGQLFFSVMPQLAPERFLSSLRQEDQPPEMRVRMLQMLSSRTPATGPMQRRVHPGILEDMVEVLELKLETIG